MDSQDNEKITQILGKLKGNQQTIFKQLNHKFSINTEIMNKFNKTVLDIQHNEQALLERIDILTLMFTENNKNIYHISLNITQHFLTIYFPLKIDSP